LREHPDFARAVPTPDHFLPILYLAGLARAAGKPLQAFVEGYALGSLSMDCYGLDVVCPPADQTGASAALPSPNELPPDETNA
jgi:4,5-DOPA dioxygenase extradiol